MSAGPLIAFIEKHQQRKLLVFNHRLSPVLVQVPQMAKLKTRPDITLDVKRNIKTPT